MSNFCKTIQNYPSNNGIMPLLFSIRDCVPYAFEGLLLAIFIILFGSQYFLIKSRTGRAKILIAILSSSFVMIVLSIFLALAQLVTFTTVLFYAFICIVSFILLIISDDS